MSFAGQKLHAALKSVKHFIQRIKHMTIDLG